MSLQYRTLSRAIALLTIFGLTQIYVFGAPSIDPNGAETSAQTQTGTLKTTNNQPISVNGNTVRPGTTILSGSSIETPPVIGATIELGSATLCVGPNTSLVLDFTAATAKVTLKTGCVILTPHGNATATIITPDGTSTATRNGQPADVCFGPNATAPIVNQGAAVNSGACAGGGIGATAGEPGINRTLLAVLIAGGAFGGLAAILLAGGGNNPSPSTP